MKSHWFSHLANLPVSLSPIGDKNDLFGGAFACGYPAGMLQDTVYKRHTHGWHAYCLATCAGDSSPSEAGMSIGGVVMIGWLMKNFVQEIPEHLSVCEVDCPNHECTINDWVSCERRQQALLQESGVSRLPVPVMFVESKVFSPSSLLKAFPG